MKVINVIEHYCQCRIAEVTADLPSGKSVIYHTGEEAPFSASVCSDNVSIKIKYSSDTEMPADKLNFAGEMLACLVETQNQVNTNDEAPFPNEEQETENLDGLIEQILNTLVCSHVFDKAAVMLYNHTKGELRALNAASLPMYETTQKDKFKKLRIPLSSQALYSLPETAVISDNGGLSTIFDDIENSPLKNKPIVAPLKSEHKIYGILITCSNSPYSAKHIYAIRSAAGFISSTMSATILYKGYSLSLSSEEQLAGQLKNNERLFTLGSYTAAIVHEIKNPLISIGGFAKRLKKAISDPNLQKMANIISTESERLERLTEDILSYTKNHEPKKQPFVLLDEMQNIASIFDIRSKDFNIAIILDIPAEKEINADKNQFRQVMVNLIANSITAIGQNGKINISLSESDNFDIIKLSDTGGGIPAENLQKLFKPFFTTSPKGTGLGLVISKKIMTNHGGNISAENGREGAVFTLTLPKKY